MRDSSQQMPIEEPPNLRVEEQGVEEEEEEEREEEEEKTDGGLAWVCKPWVARGG